MVQWHRMLVGWSAILLGGCYRAAELPIKSDTALFLSESRVLLIDRRSELAVPQGPATEPLLIAYDLDQKRVLWRTLVGEENVDLSPSRKFASVLASTTNMNVRVGVLDLSSGKYRPLEILASDPRDLERERERTSISDDGGLFASTLDGRLSIWDTGSTQLMYEHDFGAEGPRGVEFLAGSHDLTVRLSVPPVYDEGPPALVVLARKGDSWQLERRFDGVRGYGWTSRGLLFGSPQGISLYDRREVRALMTVQAESAAFSSDGRYAAYRTPGNSLNVYDLHARRVVLIAPWVEPPSFHGNHITLIQGGLVWRGDLSDGTSKVLRDFGPRSETVKIPLFGGTTSNTFYDYVLSDQGTRLYYREVKGKAWVYDVARL